LKKHTVAVTHGHVFMLQASYKFSCCAAYRLIAA
jgi:hypothetical protein